MSKKIAIILVFFLTVFMFLSCDSKSDPFPYTGPFPETIELTGQQLLDDQIGNFTILTADSLVVLTKQTEPYFRVYNSEFQLVSEFGHSGEGPGEFPSMPILLDLHNGEEKLLALFYLQDRNQILTIDFTESIQNWDVIVDRQVELPSELTGALHLFLNPDGRTVFGIYDDRFAQQLDQKRGAFIFEPEHSHYEVIELFNLSVSPFDVTTEMNINAKVPAVSRIHEKVILASRFYPIVEIVDLNTNMVEETFRVTDRLPESKFRLEAFQMGETVAYFNFADTTEDYIYLLYEGKENYKLDEPQDKLIQVLDWSGNPVYQFKIPSVYDIHQFTIDEYSNRILALSHSQDAIYSFDLPEAD